MMQLILLLLTLLIPSISFAQGLPLKDGNSSTLADVTACAGLNCLNTTGPTTPSGAGYEGLVGISGDSSATSGTRRFNPIQGSEGGGLRIGVPSLLWDDTFNATAQNTAKYRFTNATMAATQSGGYVNLNSGASVTATQNVSLQTFKVFPLFAKQELRITMSAKHTTAPQANAVTEWGMFTATLPGTAAPTDGCFFRFNASAEFRGVCSFNTTETQTAAITATSANVNHDYSIVIQTNTVVFYVDNAVAGTITLLTDAPAQGQPFIQATVPVTFRHYLPGTPSLGMQFQVSDVFVTALGPDMSRSWETQKAGFGHMASQGQNGGTMGSSALLTNNLAPGAGAAMTNTTAALGSGLGGQFAALPTLAANTDGIMASFQNPAGGINQTSRNLIITGIWMQGMVTTQLAGGPVLYFYSLAYGHTAVSLATVEGTSFTTSPTTKAPRRVALGMDLYGVAASVGTTGRLIYVTLDTPIVVAPGEFVALCAKNVGTVTSAGVITWLVGFDSYNE